MLQMMIFNFSSLVCIEISIFLWDVCNILNKSHKNQYFWQYSKDHNSIKFHCICVQFTYCVLNVMTINFSSLECIEISIFLWDIFNFSKIFPKISIFGNIPRPITLWYVFRCLYNSHILCQIWCSSTFTHWNV